MSFPVSPEAQATYSESYDIIRLSPENVADFRAPERQEPRTTLQHSNEWRYRLGKGDVLDIIVFDYPDLTNPTQQTDGRGGFRINEDGNFYYPFIGYVQGAGRTAEAVRAEIAERLREFLPDPQVEVRIVGYNSQRVVISGAVGQPRILPLTDVPLTLIDAINGAGALTNTADDTRISVIRNGVPHEVNLNLFLKRGAAVDNPVLRAGDVVNVPEAEAEEAYLLGEVRSPTAIDLSTEPLSLTQAIVRQGWIRETRADARGIFVFRGGGQQTKVFQLETRTPGDLLIGNDFFLVPGDVVYITRAPLAQWNDTIVQLLPIVGSPAGFRGAIEGAVD